MFPTHPETVCTLSAFDYQHRLQAAVKDRIAASAQQGVWSPLPRSRSTLRAAACWLGRASQHLIDARRAAPATALASDQARPAGHGA